MPLNGRYLPSQFAGDKNPTLARSVVYVRKVLTNLHMSKHIDALLYAKICSLAPFNILFDFLSILSHSCHNHQWLDILLDILN